MRKFLFGLCILSCFSLFAQDNFTISGTVKDVSNGETLLGASVFLEGTNNWALTNQYGFYSITAPKGKYTLIVSYIGYSDYKIKFDLEGNHKFNIELKISSMELDEVIINSEESDRINIKRPQMSVTRLSALTIKQIPAVLGEVDVLKSIQMLPGVTNGGEGSGGFNVRGGAVDQNLVLLDEAIIYNSSHFFGFFSVFNNDAIKGAKLYKGDIPAKYGGRVSSVLDVRQKDGNNKKLSLAGGVGLISSRLTLEAPIKKNKGSFLIAGRASYAHLFMKMREELKDDKINFYDLNLKANYEINKNNKVFLSGYFGRDQFNISNIVHNSYGNAIGNIRWNHIFNDRLFSNLSFIYSKYDYQIILDFITLDWVSNIKNYNLKYDFRYYVNEKVKLDFGFSGISYSLNPGEINPTTPDSPINYLKLDQKKAFEGGIYISAEHTLSDKLTAQYGLRYSSFTRLGGQNISNYINNQPVVYNAELGVYERGIESGKTFYEKGENIKTFGNFEPRLGLAYQFNTNTSVKASYTRSAQYLHLISNTSTVTPLDVWAPSGTFIKPQLANQFALGYYNNLKNDMYSIELESYYKTVDNRIDYIDGSSLIGNNNIETEILNGESRAYGFEILVRKNTGKFTGWFAYTISKSEQRSFGGVAGGSGINEGEWYNTVYDRTHDISITGLYKLNDTWSFSANAVFQTGRPVTYPNGQYQYEGLSIASYSNRNMNRLPAYHRLDLSATYIPNKYPSKRWKGEWVFGIYNAYNRKNAASVSFSQNEDTGINEATRTSIFGIVPSVTYNFKF